MSTANAARARILRGVADDLGAPLATRQKLDALTKRRDTSQTSNDARYMREYEERARAVIRKRREALLKQAQALDRLERRLGGSGSPPKSPKSPKTPKSPKSKSSKSPKSKSSKSPKSKSPNTPKRRLTFVDA